MADKNNEASRSVPDTLSPEAIHAKAFREAWRRGETPSITDFLSSDPHGRIDLLLELVATDMQYRLQRGDEVSVETYLERWPELSTDKDVLVELIHREWEARENENPRDVRKELLGRFPQVSRSI